MSLDDVSKKSFWKERRLNQWSFFCPLCKAQRTLPFHPRPGRVRHYIQIGLTAAVFTCAMWPWFHWRGLVSFLPFWAAFEIFYRSRVRAVLSCPHCGFDPYLYLVDIKRARDEVEKYWQKKFAEKGLEYPSAEPAQRPAEAKTNPALTETRAGS